MIAKNLKEARKKKKAIARRSSRKNIHIKE